MKQVSPFLGFGMTRSMPQDMFRIGLGKVWAAVVWKALLTLNLMAMSVCLPGCKLISPLWVFEAWSLAEKQVECTIVADYGRFICVWS